jgi:cbb3-type cytochrome oxidase subunit 3
MEGFFLYVLLFNTSMEYLSISAIISITLIVAGAFFVLAFVYWVYNKSNRNSYTEEQIEKLREAANLLRENERIIKQQNIVLDIKITERTEELQRTHQELNYVLAELKKTQIIGNSDGYIVFDLPDNHRNFFHDLLKGFEEYAKLKGYNIAFSIDSSVANKVGFKFTIEENSFNIDNQTIREDINEYINKVRKGESLDDLPVIISPREHDLILTTMKNRISFLQHSYNLQTNSIAYYENLFKKVNDSNWGIQPAIFIQTGGINMPTTYFSNNSKSVAQGLENSSIAQNKDSRITISNSFNIRKEQINQIEEIVREIKKENDISNKATQSLIEYFNKIKEELSEEEVPNKSKVSKWLGKIKETMQGMDLSHKTAEAIKWLYDSFDYLKDAAS